MRGPRGTFEQPSSLPTSAEELRQLGWDEVDVLLITGDAYVDHPSFGAALLGRWLVGHGFRAGMIAQPRWDSPQDVLRLGRPRLFAGVTAGALDSMLAHYTAFRKKRSDDPYTPGGRSGARPNRATIVYAGLVRQAFPGLLTVAGGIEASLRRAVHYDFWADALRRPLLFDAKTDLVLYGMAERAILELARRLAAREPERIGDLRGLADLVAGIRGTVRAARAGEIDLLLGAGAIELPSYEVIGKDPRELMRATLALEGQVHGGSQVAVQRVGDRAIVLEPPSEPLSTEELDALYELPFARKAHPSYREAIPAEAMIASSITSHRGCGAAAPSAPSRSTRGGESSRDRPGRSWPRSSAWPRRAASPEPSPTSGARAPTCGAPGAMPRRNAARARVASCPRAVRASAQISPRRSSSCGA